MKLLVIDVGTSGVRAAVVEPGAGVVRHPAQATDAGRDGGAASAGGAPSRADGVGHGEAGAGALLLVLPTPVAELAVLAGVPLAAILLFISNVGVRLALIVLFLYAAAIIAAPVFLGFFLGALLWRGAMKKAPCYYAELAIGILVWRVAASVLGLSFAVGLVSVPLGLGVVTLLLGKGAAKPSPKAETACEESAASDPAVLPEDSDSAEQ